MNGDCEYVFDGTDTDGTEWYLCVTHGFLEPSPEAPCAGYVEKTVRPAKGIERRREMTREEFETQSRAAATFPAWNERARGSILLAEAYAKSRVREALHRIEKANHPHVLVGINDTPQDLGPNVIPESQSVQSEIEAIRKELDK